MKGVGRSARNTAMANHLKKAGTARGRTRCPLCHDLVPIESGYASHLATCDGRRRPKAPR